MPASPFARASSMPVWTDAPYGTLPDGLELRREGDLAVLCVSGTSKVLGFVPSKVGPGKFAELVERINVRN